jgi:hypothetical protein
MTKYLSCAETAKLVRVALTESFPGVKFGVRSRVYSGGASIDVRWMDGPNTRQVESVAKTFEGSYFDGMIDYKGSIYHMIDGEQVSMGADFIFCNRSYSDATIQRAIDMVVGMFGSGLGEVPTVKQYRNGDLRSRPACLGEYVDVQMEIGRKLGKISDRMAPEQSKTAGKTIVAGDDGYSRYCGSGFTAAPVEL